MFDKDYSILDGIVYWQFRLESCIWKFTVSSI